MSTSPAGSDGVPTQMKTISDDLTAKATSVENESLPRSRLRPTSSSRPGS